jgi:HD-GYP domain-containing protein (c-di-GMP phosphodiesterase class II)
MAMEVIKEGRGRQFDPKVARAFFAVAHEEERLFVGRKMDV